MSDTDPTEAADDNAEAVEAAPADEAPEPEPPTFEEWFGRVQKTFQMHGQPVPADETAESWRPHYENGRSAFSAWQEGPR